MVENVLRELALRHDEDYNLIDVIRAAAHDVERPIFYAGAVIIAGYLPIYALAGPSGRLFQPMADTMSFALLGSVVCALVVLPVLCSYLLRCKIKEPTFDLFSPIRRGYGVMLGWCLRNRTASLVILLSIFAVSLLLIPLIGAEFMPHLDEGALWMRATAPYTISFDEATKLSPQIRDILRTFPQVTTVANERGRPDDGTDPTGFFNNEFYVGLKSYGDSAWQGSIRTKKQLIDAINTKMLAFPGVIFNYTQPAEDAVDEAETGLKSLLAVKIFGGDLATLEQNANKVKRIIAKVPGITDITVVRELGQPSLTIVPNREQIARYGLNVDDVNTIVETAIGGKAASQVIQGERQFDLMVRMQEPFRKDMNSIKNLLIATPDGQHLPLSQFADIQINNSASFIYRESNSRFIGVQFSVTNRDLAGAVEEAKREVERQMKLPVGYTFDWGGEYKDYLEAREQMKVIAPLTFVLILLILFALYGNLKFPLVILFSVLVTTEPVWRTAGPVADGNEFQRIVWARIRCADGRGGAHQRDSLLFHQQASTRRNGYRDRNLPGVRDAATAHYDDRSGCLPRAAAGRDVHRYRQRFPEALRDRDRGRIGLPAAFVDFSFPGSLLSSSARQGCAQGMNKIVITTLVFGFQLFAQDATKQPGQVTTTDRVNFAPGGLIRLTTSSSNLFVEAWDRPEVEITTIKSGKNARCLDEVHVITDRRSDTELGDFDSPSSAARRLSSTFKRRGIPSW